MKEDLKRSARLFLTMYALAVLVVLLARAGIACMDRLGILSYSYRAATAPYIATGSTLDQLCMALTGGTLVGFMFAAGLAFSLAAGSVLLFAHLFAASRGGGSAGTALFWGFATAAVSFICLFSVVLGLFSPVQLAQISGKGGSSTSVLLLLLLLSLGTLIAAASCMLRRAVGNGGAGTARRVLIAAAGCGAIVCVLTVGAFSAIDREVVDSAAVFGWMLAAVAVHLALLALAQRGCGRGASRGASHGAPQG